MTKRQKLLVNVRKLHIKELVSNPNLGYTKTNGLMIVITKLNLRIQKFNPKLT